MSETRDLSFPCTLFRSQRRMDDYFADDMRCGDLSEHTLKTVYGLKQVTETIDVWRGERLRYPFGNHSYAQPAIIRERVDYQQVANHLFDEMRKNAWLVSFFGHRDLFLKMVNHMQYGNGMAFSDSTLNFAYGQQIKNDKSDNSSLKKIKSSLSKAIDFKNKKIDLDGVGDVNRAIKQSVLPQFNRWRDRINGLGISVHGIHATTIKLKSLSVDANSYRALIHYQAQDHFGLDDRDIMSYYYHNIPLFRIWLTLQRWGKMRFKPFFVDMKATIEISGGKLSL